MNSNLFKYSILLALTALMPLSANFHNEENENTILTEDITNEIPVIPSLIDNYEKVLDVAQYKNADWSNVVGIARNISLAKAARIADKNPEITFFFYMKGHQMVLEREDGTYRVFRKGDAVFFTGEPWWGSAPGFSDGYIKKINN